MFVLLIGVVEEGMIFFFFFDGDFLDCGIVLLEFFFIMIGFLLIFVFCVFDIEDSCIFVFGWVECLFVVGLLVFRDLGVRLFLVGDLVLLVNILLIRKKVLLLVVSFFFLGCFGDLGIVIFLFFLGLDSLVGIGLFVDKFFLCKFVFCVGFIIDFIDIKLRGKLKV